jgi:hypothetical protein
MRAFFATALLLSSLASVACRSNAAKGRTSTRILFVKDGASVRYHASLHATREGRAVSLSWMRADCAATPGHYICKK